MIKKIIERAVEGGYRFSNVDHVYYEEEPRFLDEVFFSHDFLEAFFGEFLVCKECGRPDDDKPCVNQHFHRSHLDSDWRVAWQYHAQQLVLSEDRIKYLEGFLE